MLFPSTFTISFYRKHRSPVEFDVQATDRCVRGVKRKIITLMRVRVGKWVGVRNNTPQKKWALGRYSFELS